MNKNETINLIDILNKDLSIPDYQRPYEWNKANVYILLEDILKKYNENKNINLGTIILYNPKGTQKHEIVDGQQRLITLSLLLKSLDYDIEIKLLNEKLICISNTEDKIIKNYYSINEFLNKLEKINNLDKSKFYAYLKQKLNFYLLETSSTQESFQLFDGRNSKYKDLTPVDLLKAYHLGELPLDYKLEKKIDLLKIWKNNIESSFKIDESLNKIEYLFNNMLFNIYNWSLNKNMREFTKSDIYLYKGYDAEEQYEYINYYKSNDGKIFQINKPFPSGEGFFKMIEHYVNLVNQIIEKENLMEKIEINFESYKYNFKYINYLYYNALLLFHDKFGDKISEFYKEAIIEFIVKWSIMHRITNEVVSSVTINNYVLTTDFNFFFECNNALRIEELFKLEINNLINKPNEDEKLGKLRSELWKKLNYMKD